MSRVERVVSLLRQIEDETRVAFDEHTQLYHRTQSLEAENEKLRELVREMHATISDRNSWWDCTFGDTRRFAGRMRELGIEVES